MSVDYNLPDVGSQEWYSSPLYPAVADLSRRIGDTTDTSTSLAAQIAALQTAVTTAQSAANAAQTSANTAQTAANNAQTTANAANAVKPYWFGYLTASTSIPNASNTVINWTQDATFGGITYSAGVIMVPTTGRYRITAVLAYDASSTTGGRLTQVYSGSTGGSPMITGGTTGNASRLGSAVAIKTLQLSATAQFRVQAFQDAGGPIAVVGGVNNTYFQVEYLGAN